MTKQGRDQRKSVLIKTDLGLLWEEPFWNISSGREFHCLRHTQLSHQEHRESFLGNNGLHCSKAGCVVTMQEGTIHNILSICILEPLHFSFTKTYHKIRSGLCWCHAEPSRGMDPVLGPAEDPLAPGDPSVSSQRWVSAGTARGQCPR